MLFELPTALYSIIYSAVCALVTDHVHLQNINMNVQIFTKDPELYHVILQKLGRGVTYWKAVGGYTETDTYVIITIIRNIIEPRIVGAQIGLHPVLTLMSMFVGNHLFGIVGLFGLPILLSLLRYLNDNGTISLFPASALGRADTETSR